MDEFNIERSFNTGLDRLFSFLPELIGALLLIVIGYFIALFLKNIATKLLHQVGFDGAIQSSPFGNYISRMVTSPAVFTGQLTFWLVFIGFISMAVTVLDIQALNDLVAAVYGYLPHVIAALLIFLVASAVSVAAVAFAKRVMGDSAFAKVVASVVPALVMSIAVFMILDELMIAEDIVRITYMALIGAVALGLALAFGLGGRDVAARLLEQAYQAGRANVDQVKSEVKRASEKAKREAKNAKDKL